MAFIPQPMIGIGMGVGVAGIGGGGGGGGFSVNAVHFDGTNDFLTRDAALTGAGNTKQLVASFWFQLVGSDSAGVIMLQSTSSFLKVERNAGVSGNKIEFALVGPSGTVWSFTTNASFTVAGTDWVNFLLSVDSASGSTRALYINDTLATFSVEVFNADFFIDYLRNEWSVGAATAGGQKMDAEFAELYLTNEFLDFTIEANRRKFIDASGKPVDLGSDGSVPTGTAPLMFFSGPTDDWHMNKGSGGGFTETGALTDAADSPSD